MIILLSNDDGVEAPGLPPLVRALNDLGEIWVVAPQREQSAASHALTMHKPLRVRERRAPPDAPARWFHVSGTPVDCVYLAVHHLLPERPALVVSGINRGANLGTDVRYSGTVAAAREGWLNRIPALAVSLVLDRSRIAHSWDPAAAIAARVARDLLAAHRARPDAPLLLNLNVPDRDADAIKGVRACPLARRHYHPGVDVREDPRGGTYYWLGGGHDRFEGPEESDGPLVGRGWAALSPLGTEPGDDARLPELVGWPSLD